MAASVLTDVRFRVGADVPTGCRACLARLGATIVDDPDKTYDYFLARCKSAVRGKHMHQAQAGTPFRLSWLA